MRSFWILYILSRLKLSKPTRVWLFWNWTVDTCLVARVPLPHQKQLYINENKGLNKWVKAFKNGPSKICGRQPLKNLKWLVCLGKSYHFKLFKGCLPQILLDTFLNTLTQILFDDLPFGEFIRFWIHVHIFLFNLFLCFFHNSFDHVMVVQVTHVLVKWIVILCKQFVKKLRATAVIAIRKVKKFYLTKVS